MLRHSHGTRRLLPLLLSIAIVLAGCTPTAPAPVPTAVPTTAPADTPVPADTPPPIPTLPPPPATAAPVPVGSIDALPVFAAYADPLPIAAPALAQEAIAPDLSNVRMPFVLSEEQLQRLARDGFVVSPGSEKEFFTVYEQARYANVPIFVTSDSLLHVYHLLFDKTLRTAETKHFVQLLRDLNPAVLARADAQYQELRTTPWEDAARRTVAYFGVATRLLEPDAEVPAYAADLVGAELALIDGAAGIAPSPLFPGLDFGEDYSQYIPRGHYTKSDELKAYFRAMMWYGRMTFRLKTDNPEVGRAETRSALLVVQALRTAQVQNAPALDAWAALYSPTAFFVGRSDDLTVLQYAGVIDAVYGPGVTTTALADETRLDGFIAAAYQLPAPKILGLVIADTQDVEATTKGLRFMGQRFVPDAYIIRELIYRNVGTRENRRGLPNGLDVPAAFGSERAYQLLTDAGETAYVNYPEQMAKMRAWTSSLGVTDWTETLYNSWLYGLQPLLAVPGEGYPQFMRSTAWQDKQLNTYLGSYAELKHDTILYAKQAYAEMGGGPPAPEPVPPLNYVEPVPLVYARLAALTAMTRSGLEDRGLLDEKDRDSLAQLEDLAQALQAMAEKELRGEALTDVEQQRIRFYGGELEHLVMAAADTDEEQPGADIYMDEDPQAAVIADVATDPLPQEVLEVGVGRIDEIHVVVPIVAPDGTTYLQVAKGGVFAYYEFRWPLGDRLTDEKWRGMLADGAAPARPEWTSGYMTAQGEYADLQLAVLRFQKSWVNALWGPSADSLWAGPDVVAQLVHEIGGLSAAHRYEGHQLQSTSFRSYDRQSDDLAVVTVREVWSDTLYEWSGEEPDHYSEPVVGQRGPYTLDVTYTLERVDGAWKVTRMVSAGDAPEWEVVAP